MKKLVIILFFILLGIAGYLFVTTHANPSQPLHVDIVPTQSTQETAKADPFGTPVSISIPALGVDTSVEAVGMDSNGNMDVPKDADNVAWYKLGHAIGSNGSAVIAGHYDKPSGAPAVFYKLNSLQTGDRITLTDTAGTTLTYTVIESKAYPYNDFPLQKVFDTTGTPLLNLITCDGVWNTTKRTYSNRLVVTAQLASSM